MILARRNIHTIGGVDTIYVIVRFLMSVFLFVEDCRKMCFRLLDELGLVLEGPPSRRVGGRQRVLLVDTCSL